MTETVQLFDVQRNTKIALLALADELDGSKRYIDIAKLTCSVSGAVGGAMAIASLGLLPFTFGASSSLALIVGALGIGSAGGAIGSEFVDWRTTRQAKTKAEKMLTTLTQTVESSMDELPALLAKLNEKEGNYLVECLKHSTNIIEPVKDLIIELLKAFKIISEQLNNKSDNKLTEKTENVIKCAEAISKCIKAITVLIETDCATVITLNAVKIGDAGLNIYSTMKKSAEKGTQSAGKVGLSGAESAGKVSLSGAESAGKFGLYGAEGAGRFGLYGAEGAGRFGLYGAEGAGRFGLYGAESAGRFGLYGAESAGKFGLYGAEGAGRFGLYGAEGAGRFGLYGAEGAGRFGLYGAESAGRFGLYGARKVGLSGAESVGKVGLSGAQSASKVGLSGAESAGKIGWTGLQKLGMAATGVGLAYDLGGTVYYSIKVYKKKPCDVAENIRKVASRL